MIVTPNDISDVFSVLEDKEARDARASFFKHYSGNALVLPSLLKWADFDENACFLRGGVCDLIDRSAVLAATPEQDADIQLMVDCFQGGDVAVGTVEPVQSRDAFVWFLPYTPQGTDEAETAVRALYITHNLFHDVLDRFNKSSKLTAAEKRIICHLSLGYTLREIAALDAVSFETRRSQLKSACLKLQCSNQKDLVRIALGQLVHLLTRSGVEADHSQIAEQFVANHGPPGTQLKVQRLANGRLLRFIECGPADGAPVLIFHSMMFSLLLNNAAPCLGKRSMRLIMPIRPGYLEPFVAFPLMTNTDHIDQFIDDIADYIKTTSKGPIKAMGHSFGCIVLARFAVLYPDLLSKISLVSLLIMNQKAEISSWYAKFGKSLSRLATSHGVFRLLAWEFRRRYKRDVAARKAIRKLFAHSPSDIAAFEGDEGRPSSYSSFNASYQSSFIGVADDFTSFFHEWGSGAIADVKVPIQFIHGAEDSATPVEFVRRLVNEDRGDVVDLVEGAGQFCYGSHPDQVWDFGKVWLSDP
ncbi:MAG: alpha/beta fold hydrolase [Paracoccaceae bacterium]|mgnify:CR=1 FL=1